MPVLRETIQAQAVKCRYCCEFLDPRYNYTSAPPAPASGAFEPAAEPEEEASETDEDFEAHYHGSPSIFALGKFLIGSGVVFAFALFLRFYPLHRIIKPTDELTADHAAALIGYLHVVGFALALATLLLVALKIAVLKRITYDVTAERIEWARGLFGRKIDNLDMFRILDHKLHRSFADVVLGIGTVKLVTKDESHPIFEFTKVREPQRLYNIIQKGKLAADRKQGVIHVE